jgi:hypothetical protein
MKMPLNIPMMNFFTDEMVLATWVKGGAGVFVAGEWVKGATTTAPIHIITPSPVDANDLVFLDDGEHITDYWNTWTAETTVFTRDFNKDADLIQWNGRTFKVTKVDDRKLGVFVKLLLKRVEP